MHIRNITVPIVVVLAMLSASPGVAQWRDRGGDDLDRAMPSFDVDGEYVFARLIFNSAINESGVRNTAWRDWPESDYHLIEGIGRLTVANVDSNSHAVNLLDDSIFDYPWLYAVEVGSWQLTDAEIERLREYIGRGGFLIIDDFHGPIQWAGFEHIMRKALPNRAVVPVEESHEIMHIFFDIEEPAQITEMLGLTALSPGEAASQLGQSARWMGIYDDKGRLSVIINHNMDLGDAWELADEPYFPEPLTALAYRLGVNYTIYGMTH